MDGRLRRRRQDQSRGAVRRRRSARRAVALTVTSTDLTPEGLLYRPELLTPAEERALLDEIERLEFHEIRMHGVVARRTARHFEPRSGYVLAGPARTAWQHHVPPAKSLRYSITSRTLRT